MRILSVIRNKSLRAGRSNPDEIASGFALAMTALLLLLLPLSILGAGPVKYVCPMHCGNKVFEKPGRCPICGMDLVKEKSADEKEPPLNSRDYRIDWKSQPENLVAGQKAHFVFDPRKTSDNSQVTLNQFHGPALKVFFVSQDLKWFQGAVTDNKELDVLLPYAGNIYFFAEFIPEGGERQIFPIAAKISGKASVLSPGPEKDYVVKIHPHPQKPKENDLIDFQVTITSKSGKKLDLKDVELISVSDDLIHFTDTPGLQLKAYSPGNYHAWLAVKDEEKVLQFPFKYQVH